MSFGSDALQYGGAGFAAGGVVGAGVGLGLAGVKYLIGAGQKSKSNAMHLIDPGYEMNRDVIDNARIEGDQYNNYQLPGYNQILANLNNSYATGITSAERGASSGGDVIDAANKLTYQKNQQLNQLAVQQAQGKQSALMRYLAAKAAAGQEYQDKNTYDRQRFDEQLQLKNQLDNNGTMNEYGAADQAGKLVAAMFSYGGKQTNGGGLNLVKQPGIFSTKDNGSSVSNVA